MVTLQQCFSAALPLEHSPHALEQSWRGGDAVAVSQTRSSHSPSQAAVPAGASCAAHGEMGR